MRDLRNLRDLRHLRHLRDLPDPPDLRREVEPVSSADAGGARWVH